MKQNIYDDPAFFKSYKKLREAGAGLNEAVEEPALWSQLPPLDDKSVLDLGCGFGQNCSRLVNAGADTVIGIDLSASMLEVAKQRFAHPKIEYRQTAIEDAEFEKESFHLVISSLAIHYVQDYEGVVANVWNWLKPGGRFIFSVEHPICTARAQQQWITNNQGEAYYWPVDNYSDEGERATTWFVENVVKYHRTMATYANTLVSVGFTLLKITEPAPTPESLLKKPELFLHWRRPPFLILAAAK